MDIPAPSHPWQGRREVIDLILFGGIIAALALIVYVVERVGK